MMEEYRYDHLTTTVAETRYAMAAHFLNPCKIVVEVGGNHTPISNFLDGKQEEIYVIDPEVTPVHLWDISGYDTGDVYMIDKRIQEFQFVEHLPRRKEGMRGLCLMGLELFHDEMTEKDPIEHIMEHLDLFDRVVIDYVMENQTAETQALLLFGGLSALRIDCIADLKFAWQYDRKYFETKRAQGLEPSPSFGKERRFLVFDR